MTTFNIAAIINDSVVDGPGLRVTIFSQGCPHSCPGCHNPQSHSFDPNITICVEDVYKSIKSNFLCKGVTFSGGEPFCQAKAFYQLAKLLREDGYEIACYSGYRYEEIVVADSMQQALLAQIDVLIDGRYVESERNLDLLYKGSANQRIIDVQNSLTTGEIVLVCDGRWSRDI